MDNPEKLASLGTETKNSRNKKTAAAQTKSTTAETKTLFRTTQNSTKKRDDKSWSEKSIGKIIKLGGVTVHFSNQVRSKSKDWKAK
jgi:hypothetical protein